MKRKKNDFHFNGAMTTDNRIFRSLVFNAHIKSFSIAYTRTCTRPSLNDFTQTLRSNLITFSFFIQFVPSHIFFSSSRRIPFHLNRISWNGEYCLAEDASGTTHDTYKCLHDGSTRDSRMHF